MFSHIWEFRVRTKHFKGSRSGRKKKNKAQDVHRGQVSVLQDILSNEKSQKYCTASRTLAHISWSWERQKTCMHPYRTPCKNTQEEIWQNSVTQTTHKVCHNLDVSGLAIYKAYYSHESHCPELSVSGRSLAYLKIMVWSEVKLWKPLHLVAVLFQLERINIEIFKTLLRLKIIK